MEAIGGQSIIEGVMLRKKNFYSIAVRNPKGTIITKKFKIKNHRKGFLSFFNLPFFRGMYAMYEMFSIGMRSLIYSANLSIDEKSEKISTKEMFWMVLISILTVIGFFIVLPYILTGLLGISEQATPIVFNLVDTLIKLAFFIAYVVLIGQMKDVKKLFQYHGAEHKTVHCYEQGKKLTVKNIKMYSPVHSRCGSSFMMLAIFVSLMVFTLLPLAIMLISPNFFESSFIFQRIILILLRIIFIPVIIGLAYELIKLASRRPKNIILKFLTKPGHWLQKLTTAEPDNKQIEVAIVALNKLV